MLKVAAAFAKRTDRKISKPDAIFRPPLIKK